MATTLGTIITNSRTHLNESTASFWTDAELLVHAIDGCRDLWKAIIDLNQGHFQTVDDTNVSLAANTATLTGVPSDVFRVESLEVRDLTSANTVQDMTFTPKKKNHPDWAGARALGAVSPGGREIFFDIRNAGSPVAAPTIDVAPTITSAVNLRLVYTATLGALVSGSSNPIPGESDHAIMCWVIAHARAKERPDSKPDPEWLSFFATDKTALLKALTPRQIQEPDYAEALFEPYW